jgi:hypothetical protein
MVDDTSKEYQDMIGVKEKSTNTLHDFLGISKTPETEQDALEQNEIYEIGKKEWAAAGMPSFVATHAGPAKQLLINFRSEEDMLKFAEVLGQVLTPKTRSVWWPEKLRDENGLKRWISEDEAE